MKKNLVRLMWLLAFIIALFMSFNKSNAQILHLGYNENGKDTKENNIKMYPGDEFYVSFSVNDFDIDKVMAVYGAVDYDKDLFEVVKGDNNSQGNPQIGEGWIAGNINENDNTFFFYTMDDKRSDVMGFVKFRVKDNSKEPGTSAITAKNVTLYRRDGYNNYEEIPTGREEVTINVKIGNKEYEKKNILIFASIVGIIIVIAIIVIVIIKKVKSSSSIEDSGAKKSKKAETRVLTEEEKVKVKEQMKELLEENKEESDNTDATDENKEKVEEADKQEKDASNEELTDDNKVEEPENKEKTEENKESSSEENAEETDNKEINNEEENNKNEGNIKNSEEKHDNSEENLEQAKEEIENIFQVKDDDESKEDE